MRISILLFFIGFLISCSSTRTVITNEGDKKLFNQPYDSLKLQKMDVFLPEDRNEHTPFVILVHGGGWTHGNKWMIRTVQNRLLKNNIAVANINYRLINKNEYTIDDQLSDLNNAIDYCIENQANWNINTDYLVLMGESAGANLSLLYSYNHPKRIAKVISLAGPTDYYETEMLDGLIGSLTKSRIEKVLKTEFKKDSIPEKVMKMSPKYNVGNVETLLIHGSWDYIVSPEHSKKLRRKLNEENIPHRFIYVERMTHVARFHPVYWNTVIFPEILSFIQEE